tara:strand:- start:24733 stop:26166 length:1434 start_codon:yes stop_codon:yes gene_type:complete
MFKRIKELAGDSLIYGLGSFFSQFLALFLVPFYTNEFTTQEYGVLAMVALLTQFINPVMSLGLDNSLFRYFSMTDDYNLKKSYISSSIALKSIFVLFSVPIIYFSYDYLNKFLFDEILTKQIFLIMLFSIILTTMGSVSETVIRADRRPKIFVIISVTNALIGIIFSVYFVFWLKYGIFGALLGTAIGLFFRALMLTIYIIRYFDLNLVSKDSSSQLLSYGLPYIPHSIQAQLIMLFPLFIINQKMGMSIVGIYNVINKFTKPFWLIKNSVQKAWVPYKFYIHKKKNPVEIFNFLIRNYWILTIFIWSVSCILFPPVFKFLINEKYHNGIDFFPFLSLLPVFQIFFHKVHTGVELAKSQKILPKSSFVGMLAVIIISILTIDYFSVYGPILSQSLAFFLMGIITYYYAKSIINIKYSFHIILTFFLISLLPVIYIYTIGDSFLNITISILFQTTITLLFLMILNNIKKLNQINFKRW